MLNNIAIHGRLVKDPELKQTQSGVSVCSFTVAVDRNYKSGEDKITDFFDCTAWRGLAEMIAKYFCKGKEIVLDGEMQSRHWEDKEGNKRISWSIQVSNVDFCGSKGDSSASAPKENITPTLNNVVDETDEEGLPF